MCDRHNLDALSRPVGEHVVLLPGEWGGRKYPTYWAILDLLLRAEKGNSAGRMTAPR